MYWGKGLSHQHILHYILHHILVDISSIIPYSLITFPKQNYRTVYNTQYSTTRGTLPIFLLLTTHSHRRASTAVLGRETLTDSFFWVLSAVTSRFFPKQVQLVFFHSFFFPLEYRHNLYLNKICWNNTKQGH